jgi:hypothetical protein
MNFWDKVMEKWNGFCEKMDPFFKKCVAAGKWTDKALMTVWRYLTAFKKLWLAIPVALGAIWLAMHNMTHLPQVVGLRLQTNGAFAIQITRGLAVISPLAVTLVCLLLMFCSRRTLTPWFVSLCSLLIPIVLLITNTFPG